MIIACQHSYVLYISYTYIIYLYIKFILNYLLFRLGLALYCISIIGYRGRSIDNYKLNIIILGINQCLK